MLLITGAAGQLGTAVIQHLLTKMPAQQIAGLVRDEQKARALRDQGIDIRVGDYDDPASLDRAMQGIDRVLLIAGTDEHKRVQQHQNVVDAAQRAGVGCLAYTSRDLKDRDSLANRLMVGHFQTEDLIKASGLNYILFRNILYMDFIANVVGEQAFETGIQLPTGQGRVAFALRSELGEGMANALIDSDGENRTYHFTGSQAFSFADVASTLTELSGRDVTYTAVEPEAFERQLTEKGMPDFLAQRITGFLTDIKQGQEDHVRPDLEHFLGRTPASLKDGLKVLFEPFIAAG
ncbi:MAG: Male sterility domain protein [Deinococcus sp.]|nr:Male sterility domain protein [Deinococcus sp.]